MYHKYSIYQIMTWWLHGLLQRVLYLAPYIEPWAEPQDPPDWWYTWWSLWDWRYGRDPTTHRPYEYLITYYQRGCRRLFSRWIEEVGESAQDTAYWWAVAITGYVQHGYSTLSAWLDAIRGRVGIYVPYWADHLSHAAMRLFDWFPSDITAGLVSFYDKFMAWYNTTLSWVRTNYDQAKTWATDAWSWVVSTGWQLNNWWLGIRDFLDGFFHYHVAWVKTWLGAVWTWVENFNANPYGTVAGWLGEAWSIWTGIYGSILDFYNTVWIPFRIGLHDFFDHPWLWMQDRIDEEVEGHLEALSRWVGEVTEKIIVWAWGNS